MLTGPWPAAETARFLDTFFYDAEAGVIEGRVDTLRHLPNTAEQRGDPQLHPRHVSEQSAIFTKNFVIPP